MNHALVRQMIVKDWYLNRGPLVILASAGTLSIALLLLRGETAGFIGLTSAFIVMVCLGILLPMQTVVNERKKQNLPFIMSLPISPMEYTTAKILANLLAFIVLWLAIALGALATVVASGPYGGIIPLVVVASLAPFVAFCVLLAVAIVVESETWTVMVMGTCNVSYTFIWFFLFRIPGLREELKSPVAIWSQPMVSILGVEVVAIVLAIALTFYFQSKKTDFI